MNLDARCKLKVDIIITFETKPRVTHLVMVDHVLRQPSSSGQWPSTVVIQGGKDAGPTRLALRRNRHDRAILSQVVFFFYFLVDRFVKLVISG